MHQVLSQIGEWIVLTLSRRVRVFSKQQVAAGWFQGSLREAGAELKSLEKQGLIETHTNIVSGRLPIVDPLLIWEPGSGRAPNFSQLAHQARSRWVDDPKRELLVIATNKAVHRFAGYTNGKLPTERALRHDLQVSELYLHFLSKTPKRARRWIGEDEWHQSGYGRHKVAVPDAIIRHKRNHRMNILLELVGQYGAMRLDEFHRQYQGYRYELW